MPRRVLAEAAGVSVQTVKSYELGLRRPSRALLVAILDALEVDRRLRNEILIGAGFAPDGDHLGPRNADYMFTLAETEALINALPWPAHVNSELMEVLAANSIVQRLWGIDLQHEFTTPIERNLMNFATDPRFADRVKNWESATAVATAFTRPTMATRNGSCSPGMCATTATASTTTWRRSWQMAPA